MERFARQFALSAAVFGLFAASFTATVGVAHLSAAGIDHVLAQASAQSQMAAVAGSSPCQISATSTVVTERKVSFSMNDCAGVQRFQISESPDFTHPSGIEIGLSNVTADLSSADVSITYKNGLPGGHGAPYKLPEKRTVNALAVLYQFVDENGNDHGVGAYETPTWLKRFIFGDGIIGWEGVFKNNSFKDHILQSTAGRVTFTGETYPTIVHIPLEKFRAFLDGPLPSIKDEIIAAIKKENPTYFDTRQFDYYFPLSSGYYAVDRGYNNRTGYVDHLIPFDRSTSIFANTIQEVRTAHDALTVVPRYNPQTVEGVWLASDTARTGTNYFTGGSVLSKDGVANYYYAKLGTALPSANAQVIVRYKANAGSVVNTSTANVVSNYGWGSHLLHENYHTFSALPQMKYSLKDAIGDPYIEPALLPGYDMMQNNSIDPTHPTVGRIDGTPLLSAPNKYEMGYVSPYTLVYGENETSLHLVRPEFSDVTQVENNTTMIKIPLRKAGDPGLYTKREGGYYSENGMQASYANNGSPQYRGEEYLLLEMRSKQPLSGGAYNFDQAIFSEGLVVYHMVQPSPYYHTIHSGSDIAENIDATPPYLGGYSNVAASGAAFGPGTGVYQLKLQEMWQEKAVATSTDTFEYLLSEGRGLKTLYARFVDAQGNVLGTQTYQITLNDDRTAADRLPQVTMSIIKGNTPTNQRAVASYTAPNGAADLRFYMDGVLKFQKTLTGNAGSEFLSFNTDQITPAVHTIKAVFYDKAKLPVEISQAYDNSGVIPPTLTLSATPATILSGASTTLNWTSTNAGLCTASGAWTGTKPIKGSAVISNITQTSAYTLKCTGAGGSITKSATTTVSSSDITAPSVPAGLTGSAISSTQIDLSWGASTDAVGVVGYKLFRNGVQIATPVGTSFSNTTVTPSTTYTYTVAAYDAAGNTSAQAPSITITTPAPPDTTPPTTSIVTPTTGSTVSNTVSVTASASDNVGITKVEFYVDGALKSTTSSPYTYSLDTKAMTNGPHTLQTKAYDAANNVGNSSIVTVTVSNMVVPPSDTTPPSIPTNLTGSAISSTQINISWNASTDNVAVAGYTIYRGGIAIASTTSTTYSNTNLTPSLSYTYTVAAVDAAGNSSAQSGGITISTQAPADITLPVTSITSPATGATVSGTTTINASASDNVGVTKVEFYRDGALLSTDAASPYSVLLNTASLTNGSHTLQSKAYDASGNIGSSSIVTVTVSNAVVPPPDTTPPTTSMTSPTSGTIISSSVSLAATASDNVGVKQVDFYVDGVRIIGDAVSPYGASWSPAAATEGPHTLQSKAIDKAGNASALSAGVTVIVDRTAPTLTVTSPVNGTKVTGTNSVTINSSASDASGLYVIYIYIDNTIKQSCASSTTCSYTWAGSSITPGTHAVKVTTYDNASPRNMSTVNVTVSK